MSNFDAEASKVSERLDTRVSSEVRKFRPLLKDKFESGWRLPLMGRRKACLGQREKSCAALGHSLRSAFAWLFFAFHKALNRLRRYPEQKKS
ncbi:hypothetical protein COV61_02215 [Candidatus Micrarchaeota archaeon CG11_big_fil_rev_8_21_14_0_20_47_5]|nr:MAG: hypothetical protein AUJ17_03100 [Candidatus Micrarchaeota archaeon CG1_02_47_40]PIN83756.1 MAG: hypothetical protein COV61_02215 [Candidatus Micrarchaeota archaeon CG11_big_fil_rev_8_21_14_0_20_47_5]